jgi:hypothetical protein
MELLTPDEVCAMLKVTSSWLKDHTTRRHPMIASVKIGDFRRYRREDVLCFVEEWRRLGDKPVPKGRTA